MVKVDTSADISGSSTKTSGDPRSTVDRHVGRESVGPPNNQSAAFVGHFENFLEKAALGPVYKERGLS